jgi:hypothetical protein
VVATIAVDWDGVLVDRRQKWLPGAPEALIEMLGRGFDIVIHTCRANWPEGLADVETMMRQIPQPLSTPPGFKRPRRWTIHKASGKPQADLYLDDQAVRFISWPQALGVVRGMQSQLEAEKVARKAMTV